MYQLAKINLENGDIESLKESEKLLMKAAERFDYAQYALGDIYTGQRKPVVSDGERYLSGWKRQGITEMNMHPINLEKSIQICIRNIMICISQSVIWKEVQRITM